MNESTLGIEVMFLICQGRKQVVAAASVQARTKTKRITRRWEGVNLHLTATADGSAREEVECK
jgi:hypothetical protein